MASHQATTRQPTQYARDLETIGGLSAPSKMPCYSWSLPASSCKLGSLLAKQQGTVCSGCYALKGRYMMPNTQEAMARRLEALNNTSLDVFVRAFSRVLQHKLDTYKGGKRSPSWFRWHDSGDLQSEDHLRRIIIIAAVLPDVTFWLPTREVGIVRNTLEDGWKNFPANLTIRVSVNKVDDEVPDWYLKLHHCPQIRLSGVHTKDVHQESFLECPAPTQGHHCGDCRACWTSLSPISYELH